MQDIQTLAEEQVTPTPLQTNRAPGHVRVLILEDTAADAQLLIDELRRSGFDPEWEHAGTEQELLVHMEREYDLVLAENLSQLAGLRALQLVRERRDTPFIIVSRALERQAAVEAILNGADDYLLKHEPAQFRPAIERALSRRRARADEARARQEMTAAEEQYRLILETSMDAVIMADEYGLIRYANGAVQPMFGYAPHEIAGREVTMLQPERLRDSQQEQFRRELGFRPRASHRLPSEYIGLHRDGHEFPLEIAFSDMALGERQMFAFFIRDITDRNIQQARMARLSRMHAVLSGINGAILRIRDQQELLEAACRIAVDEGHFGLVWIGRFDSSTLDVLPVASAGVEDSDFLMTSQLNIGEETARAGVLATAIQQGSPVFMNYGDADSSGGGTRRKEAIRRGYRSVIALPLTVDGECVAVFCLFAKEPAFFDGVEVKLLTDLAGNISFALENICRQDKLEKLSRIRAVSYQVGAAIVRVRDREALLRDTCRIVWEHGHFDLVWIGLVDADKEEVTPIAWAGFSRETAHAVTWASLQESAHTLHEVLRTGQPAVRHDFLADRRGGVLTKEALERGCRSTVCLPFIVDDRVVGAMSVFAPDRSFFDQEEVALLTELTADISLALQSIARQEKLDYLSFYDPLTGLPNRQLFIDRVSLQMRSRGGDPRMVAVMLFEIQRFRALNEALGRKGGDELLRQVASRAEGAFHGKDLLARVGADRFGIVVRGILDPARAAQLVERQIFECFREPFIIGAENVYVAARASIALFPLDGEHADTLFANAEAALTRAKSTGEPYLFYASEMNARVAESRLLETRLRSAVQAGEFELYYQPKFDLTTGGICGLEALLRWQDPASGLVLPGAFIPMLEETGLIVEVGKWAITQALADHRAWTSRGCLVPRIAVNVSAVQIQQRDFPDKVMEAVHDGGDIPGALELEVTESLLMKDLEATIRKLSILRGLGIHMAMDDFGTGYSSLSYLARLPINVVKIDRSFITGMATNPQDKAIATTIVALAQSLNLRVVAEGIETREQLNILKALGCHEGQGYLFSKPLPASAIERLLKQGTVGSAPE